MTAFCSGTARSQKNGSWWQNCRFWVACCRVQKTYENNDVMGPSFQRDYGGISLISNYWFQSNMGQPLLGTKWLPRRRGQAGRCAGRKGWLRKAFIPVMKQNICRYSIYFFWLYNASWWRLCCRMDYHGTCTSRFFRQNHVSRSAKRQKRGWQKETVHVDTFESQVNEMVSQPVEKVYNFVQFWELGELEWPSEVTECDSKKTRKESCTSVEVCNTCSLKLPCNWYLYSFLKRVVYNVREEAAIIHIWLLYYKVNWRIWSSGATRRWYIGN